MEKKCHICVLAAAFSQTPYEKSELVETAYVAGFCEGRLLGTEVTRSLCTDHKIAILHYGAKAAGVITAVAEEERDPHAAAEKGVAIGEAILERVTGYDTATGEKVTLEEVPRSIVPRKTDKESN